MVQKPKIQYVGQFYVHGSEARKLQLAQERMARTSLPKQRLQKVEKLYVDPVALIAISVALIMLVVMVVGALQIRDDWMEYRELSSYVSRLKVQNAEKAIAYRKLYDLDDIRTKALALGLVPIEEVQRATVTVVLPEPEPEISRIEEIKQYLEDLFAY